MDPRLDQIVRQLRTYDPERIILFGSAARGERDPFSDIDLVIIKRTRRRFLDRIKDVLAILKPTYAIDILVYTPNDFGSMQRGANPFVEHLLRDGVVLYEKAQGRGQAVA